MFSAVGVWAGFNYVEATAIFRDVRVARPTITSVTPNPAKANDELILTGTFPDILPDSPPVEAEIGDTLYPSFSATTTEVHVRLDHQPHGCVSTRGGDSCRVAVITNGGVGEAPMPLVVGSGSVTPDGGTGACAGAGWMVREMIGSAHASGLAYAPSAGGYLVVSTNGLGNPSAYVSSDGLMQFQRFTAPPPSPGRLACSPTQCVCHDSQSATGATWTPLLDPDDTSGTRTISYESVTYDGSQFVAASGSRVYVSPGGVTFNHSQIMTETPVGGGTTTSAGVTFPRKWGDTWLGISGNKVAFSTGAVPLAWQVASLPTSLSIFAVAKSPTVWVAIVRDASPNAMTSEVWTSSDGAAWTKSDTVAGSLEDVVWTGTDFVIAGGSRQLTPRVLAVYRGMPGAWVRGGYAVGTTCAYFDADRMFVANGKTFITGDAGMFGVP